MGEGPPLTGLLPRRWPSTAEKPETDNWDAWAAQPSLTVPSAGQLRQRSAFTPATATGSSPSPVLGQVSSWGCVCGGEGGGGTVFSFWEGEGAAGDAGEGRGPCFWGGLGRVPGTGEAAEGWLNGSRSGPHAA